MTESVKNYLVQVAKSVTTEDETERGLSVFVGGTDEIRRTTYEIGLTYLAMKDAEANNKTAEHKVWADKYQELRQTHFAEFTEDELPIFILLYMEFIKRYLSRSLNRTGKLENEDDVLEARNRFDIAYKGKVETVPLINPTPINLQNETTQRNRMRRRHRAGVQQHSDTIGVMLYNSFVFVRFKRPTRLDLIRLINTIETKLRHFGQRLIINSINLERAGIARIIVDFFIEHIERHSVEDILDKEELKSVLLANDVDAICIALLEANAPNGVYYQMTCLANKCNHSELKMYHPHDLYLVLDNELEDDQKDFVNELMNAGKKYPIEDIRKMQNRYRFKNEPVNVTQQLFSAEGEPDADVAYGEMNLHIPTMAEYFNTFDMMAEVYNETIQSYAIEYPSKEKFAKKRSEFLGAVRMGEYVHWIKNYVTYGVLNSENPENIIEDRRESQREFEQGLLDIFNDDATAYWAVFSKILETVPYMSHTFVGFANSECSACKGVGGKEKDKEGNDLPAHTLTKSSGFTPIDPVLCFFDHTRMLIEGLGNIQRVQEELIS